MAKKIPVGGTIARAYGFAFGNIINNLGAVWMPIVILCVLGFFLIGTYMKLVVGASVGAQSIASAMLAVFVLFLGMIVLLNAQIAGLTKEALGLRTGSAFLQNPFGAATWRMIGANLLYALVFMIIYIALALGSFLITAMFVGIAGNGSSRAAAMISVVVIGAYAIFTFCAMIYIMTRLSFLIAPVVVAERRISLARGWELTKGNFWRIFVILLAMILPLFALEFAALLAMVGASTLSQLHPNMTPQEVMAITQPQPGSGGGMGWLLVLPIGVLVGVIFYGLFAGASAFAYRAVTEEDRSPEVF